MPYRDKLPTLRDGAPPPSQRVQGDASSLKASDDPETVRREEDAERDKLIGRLLGQVSDLTEQLKHVQKSIPPPHSVDKGELLREAGASKAEVRRAVIGLIAALTVLCTVVGGYIATRTEALKPKVDATATNTGINADDLKAATARVSLIEAYLRNRKKHDDCVEQQARSAFARGADHDLPSLPPGGTVWVQQHQPYRTRSVDDAPAYIALKPCPEAPEPP